MLCSLTRAMLLWFKVIHISIFWTPYTTSLSSKIQKLEIIPFRIRFRIRVAFEHIIFTPMSLQFSERLDCMCQSDCRIIGRGNEDSKRARKRMYRQAYEDGTYWPNIWRFLYINIIWSYNQNISMMCNLITEFASSLRENSHDCNSVENIIDSEGHDVGCSRYTYFTVYS